VGFRGELASLSREPASSPGTHGTPWSARLRSVDTGPGFRDRLAEIEVFRLGM